MPPPLAADPDVDPLSLLSRNPQLFLFLFIGVAWLLKKLLPIFSARPAAKAGEPGARRDGAADEAERTRRVQEQVRRRIAERRGERPPAEIERVNPFETELPAAPPEPVERRPVVRAVIPPRSPPPPLVRAAIPAPALPPMTASSGADLLLEMQNPAQARRAIILREVLGPPVALR